MGCHTWTYKNKTAFKKQQFDTAPHEFMFRVLDYSEKILTSYEEAEKFVILYIKNKKEKIMASEKKENYEKTDPTECLKKLKLFFKKYPKGIIDFG